MMNATKKQAEARAAGVDMRSPEGQAKMAEMNADRNKALKALLNAEGQATFDKNLAAMPQGRGRGGL